MKYRMYLLCYMCTHRAKPESHLNFSRVTVWLDAVFQFIAPLSHKCRVNYNKCLMVKWLTVTHQIQLPLTEKKKEMEKLARDVCHRHSLHSMAERTRLSRLLCPWSNSMTLKYLLHALIVHFLLQEWRHRIIKWFGLEGTQYVHSMSIVQRQFFLSSWHSGLQKHPYENNRIDLRWF